MNRMASLSRVQLASSLRGISLRQIRLSSGMVLFAYLVSHFLNHALGNISMEALASGVYWHTLFWQSLPVTLIFYTACIVHTGLGFWALYERRQFRWKAIEPLQLVLGLSIPAMIITHVIGVRLGHSLYGHEILYPQVFFAYWIAWPPSKMWMMFAVLVIAWTHGCIGLYFWLRMKTFYKTAAPYLLAAAILVPTLAMLGLYQGGRNVVDSDSVEWREENLKPSQTGTSAEKAVVNDVTNYLLIGYFGLLIIALLAKGARAIHERRGGMVNLSYGNGRTVRVPKGLSVLEASLRNNVPHASVCGGRARCSTCRIRVIGDCNSLPKPSEREAFVLNRVGAGADPAIRLACQLRPNTDLSFFQIFMPHVTAASVRKAGSVRIGQVRYLVSMFVDMRGSTTLAEQRLPFDTVFIFNRFLSAVSQAVIECGGQSNQFVGDGELALFGLNTNPQTACRQALQAAALIATNIDELNQFLSHDLLEPIRFGIGIHSGEVIIGDIGYRDHQVFTALGDAVNVAARLQDMTKGLECEVMLSEEVYKTAGLPVNLSPEQELPIRGRAVPLTVRVVANAKTLSSPIGIVA